MQAPAGGDVTVGARCGDLVAPPGIPDRVRAIRGARRCRSAAEVVPVRLHEDAGDRRAVLVGDRPAMLPPVASWKLIPVICAPAVVITCVAVLKSVVPL